MWWTLPSSYNLRIFNHNINPKREYWKHHQCDLVLDDFRKNISVPPLLIKCILYDLIWIYFIEYLFLKYSGLFVLQLCEYLHMPVSCWLEMNYITCCNVVGSFLPILRINTLVIFLVVNVRFYGILIFECETYDMFWCTQYSPAIPIVATRCLKYIIFYDGFVWRINFSVGRAEIFVPFINIDPDDHCLPNLLLCS